MVNRRNLDLWFMVGFIGLLVLFHGLSSQYFTRFDFTTEKRFTLSPITKKILKGLRQDLHIRVYLEGDFPAAFKRLHMATKDLLVDFQAYSSGKLHYDFVNPTLGDAEKQEETYRTLLANGIEPISLSVKTEEGVSQKIIFPAALLQYGQRKMAVQLLLNRTGADPEEVLNNSAQNLEYAFASAIQKMVNQGKPRIAFTQGHGELSNAQLYDAKQALQDGYQVIRLNLDTTSFNQLDSLDLLIIAKPVKAFSESEKYKLDYFVMHGGRVFWAIDHVHADLDSLHGKMSQQMVVPMRHNLDDILFRYGVRINNNLVADMNCAQIPLSVGHMRGQGQIQMLPWVFYPILIPTSKHPLVKNLDGIRAEFISTIDTIAVKGVKKEVILASSPFSRALSVPRIIALDMAGWEPDPKLFRQPPLCVGVLLEGSFHSDFTNRPVPNDIHEKVSTYPRSSFTKMVVVSDGDILKNQISAKDSSSFPLGYDRYTQQQYGNKAFLMNVVDYLTDDFGIIELRNKEIRIRLLDRARIRMEKLYWELFNIIGPMVLVVMLGLAQQFYRRKKYA